MKLSIVIPAYNEELRIGPPLEKYCSHFLDRQDETEIIVVINGSVDRTEEVVRSIGAGRPRLRVIVEPRKIGKGGAVLLGFSTAGGELAGFVDADGSTTPAAFQDLVDHRSDADAIIASRWLKESQVSPRQSYRRQVTSRSFNFLVRLLFGLKVTDTQCGAKLFTREAIRAIMPSLGLTSWAFDVDLLFQLRRHGFRVVERPTVWHDVDGSKIRVFKSSLDMLEAIVRLRLLYSPFRWVVSVYNHVHDSLFGPHRDPG